MIKIKDKELLKYLDEAKKKKLSIKETEELVIKYRAGDTSVKDKIVEGCLSTVVDVVTKYAKNDEELLEFISIGNLELIKFLNSYKNNNNWFKMLLAQRVNWIALNYFKKLNKFNELESVSFEDIETYKNESGLCYRKVGNNITYPYEDNSVQKQAEDNILKEEIKEILDRCTYDPNKINEFELNSNIDKRLYLSIKQRDIIELKFGLNGNSLTPTEIIAEKYNNTCSNINLQCIAALRKLSTFAELESLAVSSDIKIKRKYL